MLQTLIVIVFLVLISVLLLGIRIFFTKDGQFPNTHIGGNVHLKKKGIKCATSQDKEIHLKSASKEYC